MKDLNRIFLMGRLGNDPEQKETKSGVALVTFSLATTYRVRSDENGDELYRDETQWHRVITWGKLAEICGQYLKKGQTVFVDGTLRNRKYQGKDKTFRMAFEVHAENVHFGGPKQNDRTEAAKQGSDFRTDPFPKKNDLIMAEAFEDHAESA
jgi:single-strand DNA-binding protein